ncbi:MAG: hypothetical protein LAP87_17730 [Acidobacteriia bacterium]|nr:hypothetical protein [Terriglobia bacterium]
MKTILCCLLSAASALAQNAVLRDFSCATATASGTTYACNIAVPPSGYVTGARYMFRADVANTAAATINFNSLGAKAIKKVQGAITTDLTANDLRAGQWVTLVYDGTNMQMLSQLGNAAGGGSSLGTAMTMDLPIGGCNNVGTGLYYGWNIINGITGSCLQASLQIPEMIFATTGGVVTYSGWWPANFDNTKAVGITVLYDNPSGGSGNVKYIAKIACIATNGTQINNGAPPYNASADTGTQAVNIYVKAASITPLPISGTSTCDGNMHFVLNLARDQSVSGNSTDGIAILGVALTYSVK